MNITAASSAPSALTNEALFRLDNRVALVTGASRGIGEAIAHRLAAAGAHVIVSSRKPESCQPVVDAILAGGGRASVLACHVGDAGQIESAFATIERLHGRLDVLVNNAAANPHFGPAVDADLPAIRKTLDVNIVGYLLATQHAVRLMRRGDGGSIINVASISGIVPGPNQGIYSITKAAVIAMTKVFAAECAASGVRVNAVLPGITHTRFSAALVENDEMLGEYLPRVPLGRVAQPDEMTGAVLYLASAASSYTTGACLPVDGGYLAN
ncbi:MAG: family oxidoreductase [Polaromonas sp.]|nr:family oxidoreductase [Polaromonas sp.]